MSGKPDRHDKQAGVEGVAQGGVCGFIKDCSMKWRQNAGKRNQAIPGTVPAELTVTENGRNKKKQPPDHSDHQRDGYNPQQGRLYQI